MRTRRSREWVAVIAGVLAAACGASTPPQTETPAPASMAAAPIADLTGEWAEFWALAGDADTQRYDFHADGRFEWRTAVSASDQPRARMGRYALEGGALVLSVEREELGAGCTTGCERLLAPAKEERLPLEECPPNEEARALDASYRCQCVGGRIFWRRAPQAAAPR